MLFICHASADKDFAQSLASKLQIEEFRVWIDLWDVNVGQSLHDIIGKALKDADLVLVILSPASVKSKWCMDELHAALSREKSEGNTIILPILYTPCKIPPFLSDRVYANFHADPNGAFPALLRSIYSYAGYNPKRRVCPVGRHSIGLWSFLGPFKPNPLAPFPIDYKSLEQVIPKVILLREQLPMLEGVSIMYSPLSGKLCAKQVSSLLKSAGLSCSSVVLDTRNGVSTQPLSPTTFDELCYTMKICRDGIDFAKEVGADVLVFWMLFERFHWSDNFNLQERYKVFDRAFDMIRDYAKKNDGPDICIETNFNRYEGPTLFRSLSSLLITDMGKQPCSVIPLLGHSYGIEVEDMLEAEAPHMIWKEPHIVLSDKNVKNIVLSYHLRTSYKAFRGLSSLTLPFVTMVKDLADDDFSGWIVHSTIPWRESAHYERTLRVLTAQLRLWIVAEYLQPYLNWEELEDVYRKNGIAETNRVIEKQAERYGVPLFPEAR